MEASGQGPQGVTASTGDALRAEFDSFVRAVAHDLRAPVRHITAYGRLLQEQLAPGGDPDSAREYAGVMVQSAQNMGLLVDSLVEWARLGQVEPQRLAFDMGKLVMEARTGVQTEAAGRLVRWQLAERWPVVHGDPALLRQLWRHLLSNALKFSSQHPQASVRVAWEPQPDGSHAFYVRDEGAGFPVERAGQLFQPFQRLHSAKQYPGIGMGLALSRRIVECHGGQISAESSAEGGCSVRFTLPA